MRSFLCISLSLLLIAAGSPAALGADGPSPDNPCACTYWMPSGSSADLTAMTVVLEAENVVTAEDKYFLKLVSRQGKAVYYIKLTIPEDGKNKVVVKFEPPLKANEPYMAVLFCSTMDISMKYMQVTGKTADGEHVYFDHGCQGVVIGPGGCKYMELW